MLRTIRLFGFLLVRFLRLGLRLVVPLLLVASLAFNAALFTIQGFYTVAAGALNAVGVTTVAAREAGEKLARRKATRSIGHKTAEQVTRRVQKTAARNIASVGGEAIPLVGIAVIAGALAMEVDDACDTAKDMAGLEAALATQGDAEAARDAAVKALDCKTLIPGYDSLPSKEDLWAMIKDSPGKAYEAARAKGIALAEIDWSGRGASAVESLIEWAGGIYGWFWPEDGKAAE